MNPEKKSTNRRFHFKPFSLSHHRATMRVGTDAILLGLFAGSGRQEKVLEIGTGCGIISLLLANRFDKMTIHAIDIDPDSVTEASENFKNSPFYSRLQASIIDFNEFYPSNAERYDLVVSNPPFFTNDLRPESNKKAMTRHTLNLSYQQICAGSKKLLNPGGNLCIVLPYGQIKFFMQIAVEHELNICRQQLIFPKRGLVPNRVNLAFTRDTAVNLQTEKLTIREENGDFTNEYVDLLKDYYIALNK